MKRTLMLISTAVILGGCAEKPAAIQPVSVGDVYSSISCRKARDLYKAEAAKVPTLVASQKSAANSDTIGVLLIGLPVSSMSGGDLEGEIATTKGKLIALGARLEVCGTTPEAVNWT